MSVPTQFLIDQATLDSMNMWMYIGAFGLIAFFALLVFVIQDKARTPKMANNLTEAHRKHTPMILLAGLDHIAQLVPLRDFIAQVLETKPFGKKKRTNRFALPQKVNVDEADVDVAEDKDERKTKMYIQGMNDLNNLKVTLKGINMPIFVGTKNRTIAASFPFLSAMNWTRDIEALAKNPNLIQSFRDSSNPDIRNVGEILWRLSLGISGVDFHAVYKNIDINYDPTIQESISERDKTDGRMERAEDKDKPTKTILVLVLGIIGIIIAGAVVIKVI